MNELIRSLASQADVPLDPTREALLVRYLDLLESANQRMNLTRIVDRAQAELLHIGDSLTLLPLLPRGAHRLADVGSGGGMPGMVLAIVRPDIQVTLIEATGKKARFLAQTAAELKLPNVKVDTRRAEDVGRSDGREAFEVAAARAVATMNWLAEWMLPLVRVRGVMLAMKGPRVTEEMPAALPVIKLLGGSAPVVKPAGLPGLDHHSIVCIQKIISTTSRYPRPPSGTMGKPLCSP